MKSWSAIIFLLIFSYLQEYSLASIYKCAADEDDLTAFLTEDLSKQPTYWEIQNPKMQAWLFQNFSPMVNDLSTVPFLRKDDGYSRPKRVLSFRHKTDPNRLVHIIVESLRDDEIDELLPSGWRRAKVLSMSEDYPIRFRPNFEDLPGKSPLRTYAEDHPKLLDQLRKRMVRPNSLHNFTRPYGPHVYDKSGSSMNRSFSGDVRDLAFVTAMIFQNTVDPSQNRRILFPTYFDNLDHDFHEPFGLSIKFTPEADVQSTEARLKAAVLGLNFEDIPATLSVGKKPSQTQSVHHRVGDVGFIHDKIEQYFISTPDRDQLFSHQEVFECTVTQVSSETLGHHLFQLRPKKINGGSQAKFFEATLVYQTHALKKPGIQDASGLALTLSEYHHGIMIYSVTINFKTAVFSPEDFQRIRGQLISLAQTQSLTFENIQKQILCILAHDQIKRVSLKLSLYDQQLKIFNQETININIDSESGTIVQKKFSNPNEFKVSGRVSVGLEIVDPREALRSTSPFTEFHLVDQAPRKNILDKEKLFSQMDLDEEERAEVELFDGMLFEGFVFSRVAFQKIISGFPTITHESNHPFSNWLRSVIQTSPDK
jgi:hypothetical protein